ncbi:hypothetical protein LTR84_006692 [Exophiala bonariae]|uniref:Cytochrome P450 n=1 Tax=Exophiala bonariae TaxID=1690606 RepID=A0AAV9N4L7_9EURO|nr:hypothetical protein LTR84_006692 [Exophiala bonariae]
MKTTIIVLIAIVIAFAYKLVLARKLRHHNARESMLRGCQRPPSVPTIGLFGTGTLRQSIKATKEEWGPIWMHETLNSMGKHVHTVKAGIFDYELLVTRDAENAKAMFAAQSQDFDIGPHREKCFKSLLGSGVMTNRQQKWKHSRALIRPQFARHNVADIGLFERHFQILLEKIRVSDEDGWTSKLDLAPLFSNFTLDISTEFLFGQSVYSQSPDRRAYTKLEWDPRGPDIAQFGYHLDEAKRIIDRRGALAKYGWLVYDRSFPSHCKAVQDVVDHFVAEKVKETISVGEDAGVGFSGDQKFVLLNELIRETKNPLELRSELLNVLHASRDTTASLLGWIFYFLSRHQAIFEKTRAEILHNISDDPMSDVTFDKLWTCQYLQAVINETIRFVSIVPMNERVAIRDTTLPRGGGADGKSPVFVPKDTQVLIPTYSMQHREDIWGPDVDEYKPSRWQGRKFGWDFIPFGGGSRQCIGQQFARTKVMFTVTRMLQIFDVIENMEGPGPIKMHHTIENKSGTGVQVRLRRRLYSSSNQASGMFHDYGLGVERSEELL